MPCSQGEGSDSAHFPAKGFWICLSALLLLVAMAMGLTGYLALTGPGSTSLQTVRLTAPDQTGVLLNQTAVLDPQNHLVTLSVTAAGNQTSTVLFDVKHGLICYRPADQQRCFLQTMERSDYDHVGSLLSGPQNQVNGLSSGSVLSGSAVVRFSLVLLGSAAVRFGSVLSASAVVRFGSVGLRQLQLSLRGLQAESAIRSGRIRFQQRPDRGTMVALCEASQRADCSCWSD
ncbi:BRICHOS domain-containing protein 5 [Xiphophorus couchianus]|uniref:BRICHOS domain-containing protein 5 n=1 Tax=Xiphophorus couchianus TaxID=32473 RepID=UPI001016AC62|nr:BRICHOS domain-containing protein 5 [Xiphophorus couchianus]